MRYTRLPADFLDRLEDLLCTVRTEQIFMRSSGHGDNLERIVRLAVKQTGAALGMLFLIHEDRGDLQVAAAVGEAVEALVGQFVSRVGITGFAIDEGNAVAVGDRPDDSQGGLGDEIDARTGARTHSLLAVPLMVHGQPCGALELRNAPGSRGFAPADIELATELAHLAAAAVEEYRGERFLLGLFASALPRALSPERGAERDGLAEELARWLAELRQTAGWRRQVELAVKVRALCQHGDDAVEAAEAIVDALLTRERRRHPG
jgi:GAF domain-containing protein